MSELSVLELEAQDGELLPEREALGVLHGSFGHNHVSFGRNHGDNHGGDTPRGNSWGHGRH